MMPAASAATVTSAWWRGWAMWISPAALVRPPIAVTIRAAIGAGSVGFTSTHLYPFLLCFLCFLWCLCLQTAHLHAFLCPFGLAILNLFRLDHFPPVLGVRCG